LVVNRGAVLYGAQLKTSVGVNMELVRLIFEIVGYGAGVTSVAILAWQASKQRKLNEYRMLLSLEEKYTELLWKGSEHAELDLVWDGVSAAREELFESLMVKDSDSAWQLWEHMTDDEKDCYRYTRAGLEVLEQAFIAIRKGWVKDAEIRRKWLGWMRSWKTKNKFLPYVLEEIEDWYTPTFIRYLKTERK